uniref:Matrix extracellular phosphoglycoprotein n=1 Tax=Homo sapiens TaxID=9606 RepID=A0A8J9B5S1_HUMAN
MRVFCVGLLLFSVTWAAPTFQPQTEKTKQSCVEEQRITYKGHYEKHGHYVFKCVYMSPEKKNQTDVKAPQASLLQNSGSQNLPDPHPMPRPTSRSASGPVAAAGRKKQRQYWFSPFGQENKSRAII